MNRQYDAIYGILFMLINMFAMTCIDSSSKLLRASMSAPHIVFLYKFFLLLGMLPWVLNKGLSALKTEKLHIHLIRSLLSVLGLLFFIQGLHYIDMADAAVLENIQSILLVFIGIVFFNEQKSFVKVIAVIIGFIGAVIVINPDILNSTSLPLKSDKYYGFTLIGIGFWTLNSVTVKILGRTEKNKTQMFYLVFFSFLWSLPVALFKWETVSVLGLNLNLIPKSIISISEINIQLWHLKYIIFMAICHFIHGVTYFRALKSDISIIEPFRYSKFIFNALFGYFIFSDMPKISAYVGFLFIVISGMILLFHEVKKVSKSNALEGK